MPKNDAKAVEWFTKAAEQGDTNAQFNLGAMYDTGDGVAKDTVKAFEWYTKAANQGNATAQYNLDPQNLVQVYQTQSGDRTYERAHEK